MTTSVNNDSATNPNPGAEQKVTFTPEQQAKIDELIRNAMGRAGADAKQKADTLEAELTRTKTELQTRQAELEAAKASSSKGKDGDGVEALKAQIEEIKRAGATTAAELERARAQAKAEQDAAAAARAEVVNVRKQAAITSAASKVNFINADVAVKLTQDSVKWDEQKGRFVVLGENGQPRLNSAYEEMSLDEFYTEFAAKNPYLVRGDVRPGTGSNEAGRFDVARNGKYELKQVFGKESNSALASKLKKEDPQEYQRLRKMAVEQGMLAG